MAAYRYLLANSLTGEVLAELPLSDVTYSYAYNEAGEFSGSLPLELPAKLAGVLHGSFFSADPALDLFALYVERDTEIVWGGLLWSDQADYGIQGGAIRLSGEGWHSWLRRRVLTDTLTFSGVDQAVIAKTLVDWPQTLVFGGDAGVDTSGVTPTGRLRDRTYRAYERRNLGEALEELAAALDGFAFRYVSAWVGNVIATKFLIDYPPSRQTGLVFELPQLISARVATDRSQLATVVHGIGAGEGDLAIRALVDDETLLGARLYLDAVDTHTSVSERDTLEDHAAERLRRGSRPIVIPDLTVRADTHPMVSSYRVGDVVGAVGRVGWHQFTGAYRITEIAVKVDAEGAEAVTLKLAPEGVFSLPGSVVDRPVQPASIPSAERFGIPTVQVNEAVLFFDDFTQVHATNRGLDPQRWFIHDHGPQVNQELQEYRPSAVRVSGGRLIITATEGGQTGAGDYTSGLVTTAGRFQFLYGTIEIRLRAPGSDGHTQGLWPSLYMLEQGSASHFGGTNPGDPGGSQLPPGWPTDGFSEIDVWEWPGAVLGVFTYHVDRWWGPEPNQPQPGAGADIATGEDMTAGFHVYGLIWEPDRLRFTFDGTVVHTLTDADTVIPATAMFPIINFAIGGQFPGAPDGTTIFPSEYEIDWVRVRPLVAAAKVATLVDGFDPPLTVWTASGLAGQVSTAGGAVTVTTATNYPGFRTTSAAWDLTGSSIYAEVSQVPNLGAGSTQAFLTLAFNHVEGAAPAGEVRIGWDGGDLVGQHRLNVAVPTGVFSIPYDAVAHRFWSISEAGGTITFATSPDGQGFTVRGSVATGAVGFAVTNLDVEVVSGHFEAETDPGAAVFEGINVASGTTPPPTGTKPDATNTGLTDPGALTPAGSNFITTPGLVENLEFTGYVEVQASNVTFRNCKFNGPSSREALVRLQAGQTNLLYEDCEVDGKGTGTGVGLAYERYTARRVHIHDCVDGAKLGDGTTLEACFITALADGPGTHNDGAQSSGGDNIVVRGCTVENAHSQTSALLIGADLADIDNVLIEDNWLSGGGFTMTVGHDPGFALTRCTIRNNRLGEGSFGYFNLSEDSEIDIVGNTDIVTGDPIPDQHFP